MTLFTDWTMVNPHYFWLRGALWGIIATTLFWKLFIPRLVKFIEKK